MKRIAVLFFTLALISGAAQNVFAGQKGNFGFGIRAFYDDFQGSSGIDYTETDYKLTLNDGIHGGLNWTWFATNEYSFEIGAEYDKLKVKTTYADQPEEDTGELVRIPVTLTFRYMPPLAEKWKPYIGVGAGWVWNDYRAGFLEDTRKFDGYGVIHVVGGVEFLATDYLALGLEVRYESGEAVFREPLGLYRERIDMGALMGGIGIKYYWAHKAP